MLGLVKANFSADLAYYRRSRLLLAFLLVFLLLVGLYSLPPLFSDSSVQDFNALREIYEVLNGFIFFFAGGLGLFVISSHLRNRSLKMVFTKPCSPAVWLGSAFLAAFAATMLMECIVLASVATLSIGWHLPVRAALVFEALDTLVGAMGIAAYLILLATVMHPAIAATFALIFNAELFYSADTWAQAVIRSGDTGIFLRGLERLFHALYLLLPMAHVFGTQTEGVYTSMRVLHGEWKYILYSFGYSMTLSAFCYFLALFVLQRKRHI